MPGGWSCGRSEKTRGSPGLQANQSEKSALNGSVPIGSRPEKAQATYWLRQRLLRSRTKPLGVRARVSDRWRDLSRAAPEHTHLHRLQQDHQVQQQPVVLPVEQVELQHLVRKSVG